MPKISVIVGSLSVFEDENYYQIFNLPLCYDIDKSALECGYLRLYKNITAEWAKTAGDSEFIEQYLTMLNKAYEFLKDDLLRAEHLLTLKNIKMGNNQDEKFLENIFQIRAIPDGEDRQEAIKELLLQYKLNMEKSFASDDLESAGDNFSKLKFLVHHYE